MTKRGQRAVEPEHETPAAAGLFAALAFLSGIVIGAAAGLIGVGGGEFRIPVLLHVLRLPVKVAAGVNLIVGLFTVTLALSRRWSQQSWDADSLTLGAIMRVA